MNIITKDIYKDFVPLPPDITGWNNSSSIFEQLINEVKPSVIIEVGTWKGASAIHMAKLCIERGLHTAIYCVDTWLGALEFWTRFKETKERDLMLKNGYPQVYYQFLSNVVYEDLQDYILPLPMPSSIACHVLNEVKADLIYIDGSHEYEDVKADIINYSVLLNAKGVMFGDDYGWPSVRNAVADTLKTVDVIEQNYWVKRNG